MNTTLKKKLDSLPRREAAFIEPMECALVPNVPDGPQWVYEVLCGPPHKISSVASDVMWRWDAVLGKETHERSPNAT